MRALTIRQPWAQLIVAGLKPIENRTWATTHRGPVVIHAGQVWDQRGAALAVELLGHDAAAPVLERAHARLGTIVGTAELTDVHPATECDCGPGWGEHWPKTHHWRLARAREATGPAYPVRGSLSLWTVDDALVRRQMGDVVHACPAPPDGPLPCCGRTPFEVPRTDRMTHDDHLVTCGVLA